MLQLRTAARLLADASSLEALEPIARLLGFSSRPLALDAGMSEAAGLTPEQGRAAVVAGAGALRLLLVETCDARGARDTVDRLARRLAARAPHPLWLVLVTEPASHALVLAAWDASRRPPRVHALSVDRRAVMDSDAVTLRALHASAFPGAGDVGGVGCTRDVAAAATHAAWLDLLGRDALTRRFYRELSQLVAALAGALRTPARASTGDRRAFALLQLSRLLFLSFVEAKGWLDGDPTFLVRGFERCMSDGGDYHRRVLRPLVFGTLNTPVERRAAAARAFGRVPFLNGGLFARTPLERRLGDARWDDEAVGWIFQRLLGRYRFTAREDQPRWTDAAVDPEMLGRAFESLMNADTRRDTGAFFTPPALVARATRRALSSALSVPGTGLAPEVVEAALDGAAPGPADAEHIRRSISTLRLLDPACGSGAFLVHALESLGALAILSGDTRPVAAVRRELLAHTIFGVDVSPMAVWLCELRLWLSVLIESDEPDPLRVQPLPNLDHNVRVGDSLSGGEWGAASRIPRDDAAALARLRERYTRASGIAKHSLARTLDRRERQAALDMLEREADSLSARRLDLLATIRGPDLFGARRGPSAAHARQLEGIRAELRRVRERRRTLAAGGGLAFSFSTHFADIAAEGGFSMVLGNPPWVRPHRLPLAERRRLRRAFRVAREAPWQAGAALAGAGPGFAAQADLSALFVERALTLLRPGGTLALLLPAKLWRALAGGGVRRLLATEARLRALEDWSHSPHTFDAAVYPSLLVATRHAPPLAPASPDPPSRHPAPPHPTSRDQASRDQGGDASYPLIRLAEWGAGALERSWCAPAESLPLGGEPGAPWLLLPAQARRAFDLLRERGTRLASGPAGRPLLGVKSGCNDAYVFRRGHDGGVEPMATGLPAAARAMAAGIESALLRPLARGESMRAWRLPPARELLLWPHDGTGAPLATLPPGALGWLARWRRRLEARADARGARRWWSLFRTEAAAYDAPRVVWADMGLAPRAAYLPADDPTIPLNSCYALRCADDVDAFALTAILNSPPMAAWLAALAEPARGGYHRHLAWTLALLPLPTPWSRARLALAPLGERAHAGQEVGDDELTDVTCWSLGLLTTAVRPLLEWAER